MNAQTDKPEFMTSIYSELHQNVRDKFNSAQTGPDIEEILADWLNYLQQRPRIPFFFAAYNATLKV
ncbi:hypothetical protein EDS67_26250 [candidate division KSB1 bacterium]|nr:MAG: hypothetical protein EDS67_26250 [candidate division KSB1 bacterium]MBC6949439.1 hypothetical protein [candidate division KSB1 bacterium]RIK76067.1 MAG: hypothetical protein DCC62_12095 [candidate division KSB1 bacterium]